jgi:hypothetical protein
MRQVLQIFILTVFTLTSSLGAYADGLPIGVTGPTGATTTGSTPGTSTPSTPPPKDGMQISANGAARQGQSSNSSASQIAQMIGQSLLSAGQAMMPPCSASFCSCCPQAAMMIAMGILGLMQSGGNKSTAGQHGYVAATTNQGADGLDGYDTQGSLENIPGFESSKIEDLAKLGVKYKDGKFTLPNGKSFSLSDVNNPQAMANAGVSAADYAKAMAQAAALEKKATEQVEKVGAHTASQGFESGGGTAAIPTASEEVAALGGLKARDPASSVAGMTKSYNGELIGVAGDSLFEMMARRYRQKSKEENFLPPESAPTSSN